MLDVCRNHLAQAGKACFALFLSMAILSALSPIVTQAANAEALERMKYVQPTNLVRGGIRQFYKVFEQFPAHWSDVVGAGICQVTLAGPEGQVIDPDDATLDFPGDVRYLGLESGSPRVAFLSSEGTTQNVGVNTPTPYAQILTRADQAHLQYGDPDNAVLTSFMTRRDWLRLFAIDGLLESALRQYTVANGEQPASIDEFLDSGFSPIDRDSINPVTGEHFTFDGAPRNFFVGLSAGSSPEEGLSVPFVIPVMDNGKRMPGINIY